MPPRKARATKASKAAAAAEEVVADAAASADESLLAQATHAVVDAVKDGAHAVEAAVEAFAHVEVPTAEEVVEKMEGVVEGLHVGNDVDSHLVGGGGRKPKAAAKGKGKGKANAVPEPEPELEPEQAEEVPVTSASEPSEGAARKVTMEERQAKLKELRQKMVCPFALSCRPTRTGLTALSSPSYAERVDGGEPEGPDCRAPEGKDVGQGARVPREEEAAGRDAARGGRRRGDGRRPPAQQELVVLDRGQRSVGQEARREGRGRQPGLRWSVPASSAKSPSARSLLTPLRSHPCLDEAHTAHTKYNKQAASHKPDLALYNLQKEQALGLEPGTLTSQVSTSKAMQRMKTMDGETLYADGNNLSFAEHKPSEEAVDQVIERLNKEYVSPRPLRCTCTPMLTPSLSLFRSAHTRRTFSRKRANEDEGDVTYINDANKVFNKKINRYYDKYTKEIRANFERGTAL